MKQSTKSTTGIFSLGIALFMWCASYMIKESSFRLTYWIHDNILKKGNSIETEAALLVALLYAVVTYIAVVLLATSITRFIYKKSLFACMRHQTYRYFAFWGVLPLMIAGMGWEIMMPFFPAKSVFDRLPLPAIDPLLDVLSACCEAFLFLAVVMALLSIFSFSYAVLVRSNIYFNRVCVALWLMYAYYIAYIVPPYFEYGKWFVLFIALCYLVGVVFFVLYQTTEKDVLIPKYEILIFPFDAVDEEIKTADEEGEHDFDIFMPQSEESRKD